MIRKAIHTLKTSSLIHIVVFFCAMFVAGCLTRALIDKLAAHPAPRHQGAVAADNTAVKISMHREGDVTHVSVDNSELSEVTVTFDFSTANLKSSVAFPYTATFAPGETEVFTLTPDQADEHWEFSFTNYFKLGSCEAVPDDYVYSLPYTPGSTYSVSQGYNGKFSHKGSNQYAIDWKMPEGTPVRAARGGRVVKVKDDSDKGGAGMEYDKFNNYVLIRHDDGTLGHYCHLKKGGVSVKTGQIVKAGDLIAQSGNTGFSSGAHLHFCVFKTKTGRERVSVPVKFKTAGEQTVTLETGRKYKAPELPRVKTASVSASQPVSVAQ